MQRWKYYEHLYVSSENMINIPETTQNLKQGFILGKRIPCSIKNGYWRMLVRVEAILPIVRWTMSCMSNEWRDGPLWSNVRPLGWDNRKSLGWLYWLGYIPQIIIYIFTNKHNEKHRRD